MTEQQFNKWCKETTQPTMKGIKQLIDSDPAFFRERTDLLNRIIKNYPISEPMLERMNNLSKSDIWPNGTLDWINIILHQKLSCDFLDRNSNNFDRRIWKALPKYQKLNDDFIIKYKHKLNNEMLARFATLSEAIIEKYIDRFDMSLISMCQPMSFKFIWKHRRELDLDNCVQYQSLSEEQVMRLERYQIRYR